MPANLTLRFIPESDFPHLQLRGALNGVAGWVRPGTPDLNLTLSHLLLCVDAQTARPYPINAVPLAEHLGIFCHHANGYRFRAECDLTVFQGAALHGAVLTDDLRSVPRVDVAGERVTGRLSGMLVEQRESVVEVRETVPQKSAGALRDTATQ